MEGNKLYQEEKYDAASSQYHDALLEAPESPVIQYNIAGTEYKTGKFQEALENYAKALSPRLAERRKPEEERLLRSKIHYNRGNALYRLNKYPEAIQEYTEALKLNPDDEDAKYNLEFVRNKLKDEAQKQPQDQNQQQQQQQQQQQEQQQQNQQEDKKDQQNQEEQQKKEQQEQEQQNQEQEQPQPQKEGEITKEDAERILDALKEDEKQEQEKRQKAAQGRARVLKDW
ncbi:tetratricopeptide repeat protein [candidate division KSB1 bacterium]|nr:tetratricopeptide repeat protein [candidate division KSB1 bacterium]